MSLPTERRLYVGLTRADGDLIRSALTHATRKRTAERADLHSATVTLDDIDAGLSPVLGNVLILERVLRTAAPEAADALRAAWTAHPSNAETARIVAEGEAEGT